MQPHRRGDKSEGEAGEAGDERSGEDPSSEEEQETEQVDCKRRPWPGFSAAGR